MILKYIFGLICIFLLDSCGTVKPEVAVVNRPGIIPSIYKPADDPGLVKVQDTLYYGGILFSGHIFYLFTNRDTAFVIGYLHGLQEGLSKKWYPNKQIMEERLYVAGRKEGSHRGWWPDGKPKFYYELTNDAYTGLVKEWFSNGTLCKVFHYKDGQEAGSEKMWWENGTIRANYVIIDGEKFGLSGQKLCTNNNIKSTTL
jgi:antitoxin component YwqK of YwqJK toxin-antitoxin module